MLVIQMLSLSDALNDIEVVNEEGTTDEEVVAKETAAGCTASLDKTEPNLLPDQIAAEKYMSGEIESKSVKSIGSSSSLYSSASSSSSSSSRAELPKTLEPKRRRYCIGPGVHTLCETLKQVKVGTIEQPTIYYHTKDDDGNFTEELVAVDAIGEEPCQSSPSKDDAARYSSPMVAALHQNRSFEPREGGDQSQRSWHDRSSYRSEDVSFQQQQQHPRQPNYAPFRSMNRRVNAQRAQMQHYHRQNQTPFASDTAGHLQWQQQIQGRGYGPIQPGVCWQRQQTQQPPPYHLFEGRRLPPRASLYGLLPAQGYDVPSPSQHQPYNVQQQFERVSADGYDPAPHLAHWRGNPYERAQVPLTWSRAATGANSTPLGSKNHYPIPLNGDQYEAAHPPPDIWRRDVDFVKKGILDRNRC